MNIMGAAAWKKMAGDVNFLSEGLLKTSLEIQQRQDSSIQSTAVDEWVKKSV